MAAGADIILVVLLLSSLIIRFVLLPAVRLFFFNPLDWPSIDLPQESKAERDARELYRK